MPEQPHPYDSVAQDIFTWIREESPWYAEALRGGYRAPFSAPLSEQQKTQEYRKLLWTVAPDETIQYDKPNAQGRQMLMQTLGPDKYAQVYESVRPKQGRRSPIEPTDEDVSPDQPEIPEEV